MILEFENESIWWKGPAPFVFVPIPAEQSQQIKEISNVVTYGWGCIPCRGRVGATSFTTALIPREGLYLVPIKVAVQRAENIEVGNMVRVEIEIDGI